MRGIALLVLVLLGSLAVPAWGDGPFKIRLPGQKTGIDLEADNVVGSPRRHVIKKGENLLDLARSHGLGYQELGASYRHWDPFIPPPGAKIIIPTRWIVPENRQGHQIIVNTGDMRLYYYTNNATQVYTFPIGMGVLDFETPSGVFHVVDKRINPV
jgi:L,D-transpeptidase ErfK/SrfK